MKKAKINLNGIIQAVNTIQADIERLEQKAEFYGDIWEKCQRIENTFDDDTPTEYINHVYDIWSKASDRETNTQFTIRELKMHLATLKRTIPSLMELYEYMNR